MGCCASSSSSNKSSYSPSSSPTKNIHSSQPPRSSISRFKPSENRAPPPVEEETVKEVLSETPTWKHKFEEPVKNPTFEIFKQEKKKPIFKPDKISEVSEVCSLSESVSTITDRREDEEEEEEETRPRVNRSPARTRKNRSFSGERRDFVSGKSPVKRTEQSPAKRNVGSGRILPSRDQIGNNYQHRRRDSGENSGRRSRSPATRTDIGSTRSILGRSPSARRMNQSPARVGTAVPECGGRKMENATMEGKWPPLSANESLENPLVSLECFIFL